MKLKVYGWTGFYPRGFTPGTKNCHYFMAAPSKAAVYRATGKRAHDSYSVSESRNEEAMRVALAKPGTVFFWDEYNYAPRDRVAVEVSP